LNLGDICIVNKRNEQFNKNDLLLTNYKSGPSWLAVLKNW